MAFKGKALIAFGQMACFVLLLNGCGSSSSSSNAAPSAIATGGATATSGQTSTATTATPADPTTTTTSPATTTKIPVTPVTPVKVLAPVATANSSPGPLSATNSGDACLPITMPPKDVLFNSPKKIFAHYFYPFPMSIDNRASAQDYYNTQFLNKNG